MTQTSTHHQLLLHITDELAPAERNAFEHVLISDNELQQDYRDFTAIIGALQAVPVAEPRENTLRLLLDYARA